MRVRLFGQYTEAVKRADSANEAFAAVAGSIPSGTPPPDGIQRIHNASHEMEAAQRNDQGSQPAE